MKHGIVFLWICSLLSLTGCHHNPASQPGAQAPSSDNADSCLFSSPDQVSWVIDNQMQTIAGELAQAKACASQTQAVGQPAQPGTDAGNVQNSYLTWLDYVSGAIRNYAGPTMDEEFGRRPDLAAFEGLGSDYQAVAQGAEGMDQYVAGCGAANAGHNGLGPDGLGSQPAPNPHPIQICKDTGGGCPSNGPVREGGQTAVGNFLNVGEGIFVRFKGCNETVRRQASDYLQAHYRW